MTATRKHVRSAVRSVENVDGVVGTRLFFAVDAAGQPVVGPKIGLIAHMHGNEPVGAQVFERLVAMIPANLTAGEVLLVWANQAAAAMGLRHTPEGTDLNRMWSADTLERIAGIPPHQRSYEQSRALELAPLLQSRDALLDLHSASQPSPPFLVVRDDQQHSLLVQRLGVERVITGLHEEGILGGAVGPDVGLLLGERSRRIGMTLEAGQHADPENRERASEVVLRFLDAMGVWRVPPPPSRIRPRVFEVIERFRQAPAGAPPFRFPGWSPGQRGMLASGRPLASFERVEAGEEILRRDPHDVVRAASPFTIILPTPTADPGTDLYYVALERRGELYEGTTARSADEARIEARAIERVLDVLDDDELASGSTWVSFDRRQVLDLTADLVLRTARLPQDHPHRRLAIVGRGDWGGGGSERGVGRRYRHAVGRALADGVPFDRYQLLRGAAAGWLDALTGDGMARALEGRRRLPGLAGEPGTGIRLFLSASQPSTVALLVTGDLERALRENDPRHVRVGLVIEAPVVEPDGEGVAVRVLRCGLFSSRIEFLRTAHALLATLREQHASLVRQEPLASSSVVQTLLGPDEAIVPPVDRASLTALGQELRRLQQGLWRDALRHDVVEESLSSPTDIGSWLQRTMNRSGVLDPVGLRRLVDDQELRVDPSRLEADLLTSAPIPLRRRTRILPPLSADEVDADTYARWVSWKRFLRQRQLVPDTRGQDLDLMFDEVAIGDRILRWFQQASEQAARVPGQVQIVMAGNGLRPQPGDPVENPLVRAHLNLLLDANVRYLRIQHATGSYLRWLKGLVVALHHRDPNGAPAGLRFEREHGTSVNIILVMVRDHPAGRDWNFDGWRVERCAVLVSSLGGSVPGGRVGVFTEPLPGRAVGNNPELLQYGRAHCEALLMQAGDEPLAADPARAEMMFVEQLARWIERVRDLSHGAHVLPQGAEAQERWIQSRLGLADPEIARALVKELTSNAAPRPVARAIWDMVVPWPEV